MQVIVNVWSDLKFSLSRDKRVGKTNAAVVTSFQLIGAMIITGS